MELKRLGLVLLLLVGACGDDDDDNGEEADILGVGAQCSADSDCYQESEDAGAADAASGIQQSCLKQFRGGYCGVVDCGSDADCPEASVCVAHSDGQNYCFRSCTDKPECNQHRSEENESNCSSNITRVDGGTSKACVPPPA